MPTRNDLISAAIRVIGVVLVVEAILDLPGFIISFITTAYYAIRMSFNTTVGAGFDLFLGAGLGTLLIKIVLLFLVGFYLLGGGKWFYDKATKTA